ncbi:MAG: galactokinase [Clostridiales bacterium]|nr:galactokinase [Clostridiales bacterium]
MLEVSDIDFKDIYGDNCSTQKERYGNAVRRYEEIFGRSSDGASIYSAPGRTEICGNHTDHQRGSVVAASVNVDVIAVAEVNGTDTVRVLSEGLDMITVSTDDLSPRKEFGSAALIRGVLYALRSKGYQTGGFDAYITSDVLSGSGLSSSAAFETAIGTVISGLFNDMTIPQIEIAKAGQLSENMFFGKPCGLMDQTASAVGSLVAIDFSDPGSPLVKRLELDTASFGYDICITDTKGSHAGLTGEYAAVTKEMGKIASLLGQKDLHDVTCEDIISNIKMLRKNAGDRSVLRALHFVSETKRAKEAANALEKGDIESFLCTIRASGNSSFKFLQNVYVSSAPENQPVSLALAVSEAVLGEDEACRVHGGGFAGTIQAFVKKENTKAYKKTMESVFGEGSCSILSIRKYGGIKVI